MMNLRDSFGKYREIVRITVAFFLVFNCLVLGLNYYISLEISSDAVSINFAGRQRALSQRMVKSLYGAYIAVETGKPFAGDIKEFAETARLFDETLQALSSGGEVGDGSGNKQTLKRVDSEKMRAIMDEAHALWEPRKRLVAPLMTDNPDQDALVRIAVPVREGNSNEMFDLMNRLTIELQAEADARANRLRWIQVSAVLSAMLAFPFVLLMLIRRLRQSDAQTEAAHQETDDILATVREGLFLLDADLRIGNQYSRSLGKLLDWAVAPGASFSDYLRRYLNAKEFDDARDFIELLFSERVLEDFMGDINPLERIEMKTPGGHEKRYLSFQFNQVHGSDEKMRRLLVTVQDVTEQTILAHTLESVRKEAKGEISVLLNLLDSDPVLLKDFLENVRKTLAHINQCFESLHKGNQRRLVEDIFRQVHTLKGEAATLNLEIFVQVFQSFEGELRKLRENSIFDGENLLALMPHFEVCFARAQQVDEIIGRLRKFQGAPGNTPEADAAAQEVAAFSQHISQLTERIAKNQGKTVRLETDLSVLATFGKPRRRHVYSIITQCVRNAIVHGVESPEERRAAGKPEVGRLSISLQKEPDGNIVLECRDDGQGIDADRVRQSLIDSGQYSAETLQNYTPQQIVGELFKPGVSTTESIDEDAGQGVGLSIVKQGADSLGGVLNLKSQPGEFTAFNVRFHE